MTIGRYHEFLRRRRAPASISLRVDGVPHSRLYVNSFDIALHKLTSMRKALQASIRHDIPDDPLRGGRRVYLTDRRSKNTAEPHPACSREPRG